MDPTDTYPAEKCYRHPTVTAVTQCPFCNRPICNACNTNHRSKCGDLWDKLDDGLRPWGRWGSPFTVLAVAILILFLTAALVNTGFNCYGTFSSLCWAIKGFLPQHPFAGFWATLIIGIGLYVLVAIRTSWWNPDALVRLTKFQRFLLWVFAGTFLVPLLPLLLILVVGLIFGGGAMGAAAKAEIQDTYRRADEASIRSAVRQGIDEATRNW